MCNHSGRHLFCIGLGVVIGILIAPQKGKITRRELASKVDDIIDTIKEKTHDTINDAERTVSKTAKNMKKKARSASDAIKTIAKHMPTKKGMCRIAKKCCR